jgi:hypothetical protein
MNARRALLVLSIQSLILAPLMAAEDPEAMGADRQPALAVRSAGESRPSPVETAAPAGTDAYPAEPRRYGPFFKKVSAKLDSAFTLAVSRVAERPTCRALFAQFGEDGLETLARGLYVPATRVQEDRVCRNADAFTWVGVRQTRLCRSFARLPEGRAALVLIHEALHQAGMTEKPLDPQALDSAQINQLVRENCAL